MRRVYTLIFTLALPIVFLRLLWRSRKAPEYRERWNERLGNFPTPTRHGSVVWFHTVSVGEFIAATPLIRHYLQRGASVVVTTTTPTGSAQVRKTFGDQVFHVYGPYDLPLFVNRFLNKIKPKVCVLLETELWPNLIRCCKRHNIPVILANARLSEKSFNAYARFPGLSKSMLNELSFAAIQNETDAKRFVALGLPENRGEVIGSIKFDLDLAEELRARAQDLSSSLHRQGNVVWIAASTHAGEDEIILEAYRTLKEKFNTLKLILVPRHPERFATVRELCDATGFKVRQRSLGNPNDAADVDILLGDTMGELMLLFGAADVAFIGGSLVEKGGHNYIEAAAWALPIVSGPSTYNFSAVAKELQRSGSLTIVNDANDMVETLAPLLEDDERRRDSGLAGKAVADKNRGATQKLIGIIDSIGLNSENL